MRHAVTAIQVVLSRTTARVNRTAGQVQGTWVRCRISRAAVALAVAATLLLVVLAAWPAESAAENEPRVTPVPWQPADRDRLLSSSPGLAFTRAITEPGEWALADTPWPTYQHDFQRTGRSPYVGSTTRPAIRAKLKLGTPYGLTAGPGNTLYHKAGWTYVVDLKTHRVLSTKLPGWHCKSAPTHLRNGSVYYGSWYFGAFDAASELVWGYQPSNICIHQTPAVDPKGIVYFVLDWTLAAADAFSGQLLWRVGHDRAGYAGVTFRLRIDVARVTVCRESVGQGSHVASVRK